MQSRQHPYGEQETEKPFDCARRFSRSTTRGWICHNSYSILRKTSISGRSPDFACSNGRWFDVQFPEFVVVTEEKMPEASGNRGVSPKVPAYRRLLEFVFQGRDIAMLLKMRS